MFGLSTSAFTNNTEQFFGMKNQVFESEAVAGTIRYSQSYIKMFGIDINQKDVCNQSINVSPFSLIA